MKYLALAAILAAGCAIPAYATDLDISSGFAAFSGSQTAVGTDYTDTFTFTTDSAMNISGTAGSHWLRDVGGTGDIVSNLNFDSIVLDGTTVWSAAADNTDMDEDYNLASMLLLGGSHTLTVTYDIAAASTGTPAGYSGTLTLSPLSGAVPEPASWALMLGGFGLVGGTMRSRRRAVSFAA